MSTNTRKNMTIADGAKFIDKKLGKNIGTIKKTITSISSWEHEPSDIAAVLANDTTLLENIFNKQNEDDELDDKIKDILREAKRNKKAEIKNDTYRSIIKEIKHLKQTDIDGIVEKMIKNRISELMTEKDGKTPIHKYCGGYRRDMDIILNEYKKSLREVLAEKIGDSKAYENFVKAPSGNTPGKTTGGTDPEEPPEEPPREVIKGEVSVIKNKVIETLKNDSEMKKQILLSLIDNPAFKTAMIKIVTKAINIESKDKALNPSGSVNDLISANLSTNATIMASIDSSIRRMICDTDIKQTIKEYTIGKIDKLLTNDTYIEGRISDALALTKWYKYKNKPNEGEKQKGGTRARTRFGNRKNKSRGSTRRKSSSPLSIKESLKKLVDVKVQKFTIIENEKNEKNIKKNTVIDINSTDEDLKNRGEELYDKEESELMYKAISDYHSKPKKALNQ